MPQSVSGPSGVPPRGDSERGIEDALARLEERLTAKIDALAEQLADAVAEAEEIRRRAAPPATPSSPRRRPCSHRRRGDTFLYVVRAALVAFLGLGVVLAMMAPRHLRDQQYTRRGTVQVVHQKPGR